MPYGMPFPAPQGQFDGLARTRSRRIFGIPVETLQRGLRGFAGGLAAGIGAPDAGQGFAYGLAGSLGTMDRLAADRAQAEAQRAEAERQARIDALNERRIEAQIKADEWAVDPNNPDNQAKIVEASGILPHDFQGPMTSDQVRAPEGLPRGAWDEYFNARGTALGKESVPGSGRAAPQFSAKDSALIGQYLADKNLEDTSANRNRAVFDIQTGRYGSRPVITERETQGVDRMNRPLYIGPDGRTTPQPKDPKTGLDNPPYMVRSKNYFGSPWDSAPPTDIGADLIAP